MHRNPDRSSKPGYRAWPWGTLALACAAFFPLAVQAQEDAADALALRGIVIDAARHTPIEGVGVQVVGTELAAISDASGRFELRQVPDRYVVLRATHVAYETLDVRVHPRGLLSPARLLLVPRAIPLEGVSVTVQSTRHELEMRRKALPVKSAVFHRGQFIGNPPDDLAAWAAVRTGNPLVGCPGDVFTEQNCMVFRSGTRHVSVVLDEMPLVGGLTALRMLPPFEIGRIEVYPACGTMRVYTVRFLTDPNSERWIAPLRC